MSTPPESDTEWVQKGREHSDAGRYLHARQCYERALAINPANSVATRRLEALPYQWKLRTAYRSGCLVCGISITSLVDKRCKVCGFFVCPKGHCLCTELERIERKRR
jgi:tetratricopeptide (TPR) repeat protein